MKPSEPSREAIFEQARTLGDPAAREHYLAGACAGDGALRREVDRLIEAAVDADAFFGRNAGQVEEMAELVREASGVGAHAPDFDGPGSQIGRYKLLQRIGEGGFGSVYMAEQKEPVRRRVALKIIKLGMDTRQVVARFEAERQALAMMDHPNIARVLDGGCTEAGRPYFVMELVKGEPITRYCDAHKLPTGQRLQMFASVCQAIQHAHQKGIVHRDIKPSNILIATHDGKPVPKVIDFGIAKAMQHDLTDKTVFTQFEQFMGTPAYMSPEQAAIDSTDIDTRSDIYSLGILLYELLTGVTPLAANELTSGGYDEIRRKIREVEPPRPSNRVSTLANETLTSVALSRATEPDKLTRLIRGDLDWIILKAIDKDRNRRYETANGLALDIGRFLNDEPVTAVKPSLAYLARKFARRHRAPIAAAATFVALLATGATVSTAQAIKAKREEAKALRAAFEADIAKQNEAQLRETAVAEWEKAERNAYTAGLTLAQSDWEKRNYDRVRNTLTETAGYADRSFEWFYWQRQTHLESSSFPTYAGGVRFFALHPDGSKAALVMEDNTIEVRSLPGGEHLTTYTGHSTYVTKAQFSPDGTRIASCGGLFFDGVIKIWNPDTGAEIVSLDNGGDPRQLDAVGSRPYALSFSADGRYISTGSQGRLVRVWDARTGQLLHALGRTESREHEWSWVLDTAFTGDGSHVVFTATTAMGVFDLETGRLTELLEGSADRQFGSLVSSPHREWIAVSEGEVTRTYDLSDGAFGDPLLEIPGSGDLALSADGRRLLASRGGDSQVFDAGTGEPVVTLRGGCYQSRFLGGSDRIVSTDGGRRVKVWEADPDHEVESRDLGRIPETMSRDGSRIVVHLGDRNQGELGVVETATGKLLSQMLGHAGPEQAGMDRGGHIDGAAFSPDGEWVASGGRGPWNGPGWQIIVWNALTGEIKTRIDTPNIEHYPIQFGPEGETVVSKSTKGGGLAIWDVETGEKRFETEDRESIMFALTKDGKRMAASTYQGYVRIIDIPGGEVVLAWKAHADTQFGSVPAHGNEGMAFTEDGRYLFTSGNNLVKMWEVATGALMHTFRGHQERVSGLMLARDERRLISFAHDGTLRIWDVGTGKELLLLTDRLFPYKDSYLWSVAMSPDGSDIIAANKHRNALVTWRAATPAESERWGQADADDAADWAAVEAEVTERRGRRRDEGSAASDAARERLAGEAPSAPTQVRDWLVLGPVAVGSDDPDAALDLEQVPGEARLRPRGNERVTAADGAELGWRAVSQKTGFLDAAELFGEVATPGVAYAVAYIDSDSALEGVKLYLSLRGETKFYFNGDVVDPAEARGSVSPVVDLKKGTNVALLKFPAGGEQSWQGRMWLGFADRTKGSVPAVRLGLDP